MGPGRESGPDAVASWEEKLKPSSVAIATSLQTLDSAGLKDQVFLFTRNKYGSSPFRDEWAAATFPNSCIAVCAKTQQCVDLLL